LREKDEMEGGDREGDTKKKNKREVGPGGQHGGEAEREASECRAQRLKAFSSLAALLGLRRRSCIEVGPHSWMTRGRQRKEVP